MKQRNPPRNPLPRKELQNGLDIVPRTGFDRGLTTGSIVAVHFSPAEDGGGGVNEWLGKGVGPSYHPRHFSAVKTALLEAL